MKKFLTIMLALTLALTLGISAFAANLTIGTDADRAYKGYKLMTLTTSLKSDDACADGNHNKDCYNYAYTIADAYDEILQQVTGKATNEEVLEYLENEVDGAAMQELAKTIYAQIAAMDEDVAFTGTTTTIDQGYWLIADVTDLNNKEEANSLVMVKTMGQQDLEINTKVELPSIEKKVEDVNDTDGTKDWGKTADYDMGDNVPFKLTATVHQYINSYDEYSLIFEDTMSDGLKLNADSIVVKVYAEENGAELTVVKDTDYTVVTGEKNFTVTFDDITAIADVDKNAVFEVTYTAELVKAETIDLDGYDNNVTLKFSNNPYDADSMGTMTDNAKVYTYQLVINKVDDKNAPLTGAGFILSKKNADGEYVPVATEKVGGPEFIWTGLDDGDYKLEEKTVPAGYNKMEDLEFSISAEHDEVNGVTKLESDKMAVTLNKLKLTKVVENKTGSTLPETGAMGTMWLILGGAMLVIVAGVFMITRKKMSIYED